MALEGFEAIGDAVPREAAANHGPRRTGMTAKEILARIIRYSGLPWWIRNVVARNKASLVLYHDPTPETFERHMAFLSQLYNFVELDRVVDALHENDWSRIPERALVITFDDGHARNRELLEIAQRYGARPTVYLCSQVAGTRRRFWFGAGPSEDMKALMRIGNAQRLTILSERFGFDPTAENPADQAPALSRDDIAAMKDTFLFGSHTRFHPILTACDAATCRDELVLSRSEVEALVGKPCPHFAYPNGTYTNREVEFVREAGYHSARTTDVGWTDPQSDPYRLKITGVSDDASIHLVVAQLSGIATWLRYASEGRFDGRSEPLPIASAANESTP